ncbi:TetR/AcrR family transcriptional regulator [Adlercreutzia shanghongiae]|uniref:TetR family transcriptional regulator n=1 Tax=Adlercreutzia shanghongiae TaxID=3111773 RepID=A0ABU6J1K4_9ACTN|nr:TetR family transcriptional regulator [Adlercreutzia sp. R22]MEC4295813.1 TetR family transcriptional regulator [Adlercreutzia sp. R22]
MSQSASEEARPALSRESIVCAATVLIEREGLRSFTMRSLGKELGVSAMAVYSHFSSRGEVLAAVLERFMATMDTDPVPGERWDDTLRRTMTSIYREGVAHPEISSIEVEPGSGDEGLASHTDKIIRLHLNQGMPEDVLSWAWAMVDAYLTGFTGNAVAVRKEKAQRERGNASENTEAPEAPFWRSIVDRAYTDEAFAHGVEIIIEGVRGLAAPDPCEWRTPEDAGEGPLLAH